MERNRIGDLRREKGWNQKELGDKLGVGQTTVSAWEAGKNEPDYKSIRAMVALFGVSADYLLGFEKKAGMWFEVLNAQGRILYYGNSWPMARVALDYAVMQDNGCPVLTITPISEP